MRAVGVAGFLIMGLLLSLACSSGSGGGSSGTTYSPNPALCSEVCASQAGSSCNLGTPEQCQTSCEDARKELAECLPETDAWLACGAKNGFDCTSGSLDVAGCEAEKSALSLCGACIPIGSDSACDICAKQGCCAEYKQFGAAPDLQSFTACIGTCTTAACVESCEQQSPQAASAFHAVDQCRAAKCPSACGGQPSTADPVGRFCAAAADAGCPKPDCEQAFTVDDPFGCGRELYAAIECAAAHPVTCVDGTAQYDEACVEPYVACTGIDAGGSR